MPKVYYRKPLISSKDKELQKLEITMWLTSRLLTFLERLDLKGYSSYNADRSRNFALEIRGLHNRASRHILPDID